MSEHLRRIGAIGGRRRIELHGNPGTVEGRKCGGARSIATHAAKGTNFKVLRKVA